MQSIDTAYENLANAIIIQAVTDYRNALNGISYNKHPPEIIVKRIEKFFRSNYFKMLTHIKGEYLIERLKQEHLERSNNESNTYTIDTSSHRNDFKNSINLL